MDAIAWLKQLDAEIHKRDPLPPGIPRVKLEAARPLSDEEWQRVVAAIEQEPLIVEMVGTNMFGGVGVCLHAHPSYPGLPTEGVILLTQDHIPIPGRPWPPPPTQGSCSSTAYELFHVLASTPRNLEWVKQYHLQPPRPSSHYCY